VREPGGAGGEADIAGAAQRGEEAVVLERLAAVEGARHCPGLAGEILHCKPFVPRLFHAGRA
jgi:hypothetical protein